MPSSADIEFSNDLASGTNDPIAGAKAGIGITAVITGLTLLPVVILLVMRNRVEKRSNIKG